MFDWVGFLAVAEALLVQSTATEAAQRTAISRAYYALFCAAGRYVDPDGATIPRDGRAHRLVWESLESAAPSGGTRRIAQVRRRLKQRRERADYDEVFPNLDVEAPHSVALARRLFRDVPELKRSRSRFSP